jgi:hypothetical protein
VRVLLTLFLTDTHFFRFFATTPSIPADNDHFATKSQSNGSQAIQLRQISTFSSTPLAPKEPNYRHNATKTKQQAFACHFVGFVGVQLACRPPS